MKIYYIAHKLLQSKHKYLFPILLYTFILLTYHMSMFNTNMADCMLRSNSFPSLQADKNITNNNLEFEIFELTELNSSLEKELQATRDLCIMERAENEYVRGILEENQQYLIRKNFYLETQLLEANQTIGKMAGDNIDLRAHIDYQKQYIKAINRNLETYSKHIDDLTKDLESLKKALSNRK